MIILFVAVNILLVGLAVVAVAQEKYETDIVKTSAGDLKITFIGHSSLMFTFGGKIIHVDPSGKVGDYTQLPKADLILVVHEHRDHFDPNALAAVRTEKTQVVLTRTCAEQVKGGMVMKNGDVKTIEGLKIEAVPAYNIVNKRQDGQPYHPKGIGNGYILTFGDMRVYVAGDTENTPEVKALKGIDVAFLPMNIPSTMTPEMVSDAAKVFKPKVLYPYHFVDTDTSKIVDLLRDDKEIEIRIRKMK